MRNDYSAGNFDLQLQHVSASEIGRNSTSRNNLMSTPSEPTKTKREAPSTEMTNEWISAFNTSIITTQASPARDRSEDLAALMQTPEFASLLVGARHLSETQALSKEEATERLIETFRKIDSAWKQIVMKRGMQSLID